MRVPEPEVSSGAVRRLFLLSRGANGDDGLLSAETHADTLTLIIS